MKKRIAVAAAILVLAVLLIPWGLRLWVDHQMEISEIPGRGTYTCEELSMSVTFGNGTIVTLPDGAGVEVSIDYGLRVKDLYGSTPAIDGWYKAHLEDGYIEITFESLPVSFEPDHTYRFEEKASVLAPG